jgi:hypothetical protein
VEWSRGGNLICVCQGREGDWRLALKKVRVVVVEGAA